MVGTGTPAAGGEAEQRREVDGVELPDRRAVEPDDVALGVAERDLDPSFGVWRRRAGRSPS